MAYGSLGPGQFLIWEVGYLGPGPIQVSLVHVLSVPQFPLSQSCRKWLASFLVPLPPSLTLIAAKHPRTLHRFPRWGSAVNAEGERLGSCQEDV